MKVEFSIYLASKTRWAHLTKIVDVPAMPRVGEFVKFRNEQMGDYFAFDITQVTYRESCGAEIMTALLDNIDDRMYSFEEERELDRYVDSYLAEGWRCDRGIGPNNRLLGKREVEPDGA
jgi:hypothetical protein